MAPPPSYPDVNNTYPIAVPLAGAGLAASQDISPGDLVIRIRESLLAVPDSPRLVDTCSNCFVCISEEEGEEEGEEVRLKKCGGCGVLRFCGEKCQTQAWQYHHKYECKIYKRLYPNILPNTVRMVMQLLLRWKAKSLPNSEWDAFIKLQHHLQDFKSSTPDAPNNWQNIQLMAKAAREYSGTTEPLDLVESLLGRILINTLTLTTPTYTPLGLLLSPLISLTNHSCAPNAVISYSGPILSLRALLPIPKSTQVTISYIDITAPPSTRQTDLHQKYFFDCSCPECIAGTTLGLPSLPPSLCPGTLPLDKLEALEALACEHLASARVAMPKDTTTALSSLIAGLRLFRPFGPTIYPPYRQPLALIRAEYILASLATGAYIPAFTHSLVSYFHTDPIQFPPPFHPVRVVHKWVLLRLVIFIAALSTESDDWGVGKFVEKWELDLGVVVWGLVKEVEGNVGRSHGEESVFAGLVRRKGEQLRVDMRGGEQGRWGERIEGTWKILRRIADEAEL